jgi:arylsulfatase A-like enzyme
VASVVPRSLTWGLLTLVVSSGCGVRQADGPPPNVLVLVVDALRADALGANGYPLPTTPHLDALIAGGATNFTRAYSHSTWTKPSMATLFTSLYPARHGIRVVATGGDQGLMAQALDESWATMAEEFSAAGYQTGAVINQVHLDRSGFRQGFDTYLSVRGKGAGWLNERLFAWFDGLEPERPFFGYLHYLDVHWPYTAYLDKTLDSFGRTKLDPKPPRRGNQASDWAAQFDEESIGPLRARYDREVSFVDRQIGFLWEELERRGWAEETILVVTSDHGEGFLEHGRVQHGYAPYREVVHVPLVLRLPERLRPPDSGELGPGGTETREITAAVGLVDVMPTLLELAGIEAPAQCEGRSLVELMRGVAPRRGAVYSDGEGVVAARSARHSVLRWADGRLEFFDLEEDPFERAPLADCGEPCARLAAQVEAYAEMLESSETLEAGTVLTAEEIEELKALGYL